MALFFASGSLSSGQSWVGALTTPSGYIALGASPPTSGAVRIDAASYSNTGLVIKNAASSLSLVITSGGSAQFYTSSADPFQFGANNLLKWKIEADAAGTSTLTSVSAIGQIAGGATSLSLRNNAKNADNVYISDAGGVLMRGAIGGTPGAGVINAAGLKINGVDVSTSSDTYWLAGGASGIEYTAGNVGVGVVAAANVKIEAGGTGASAAGYYYGISVSATADSSSTFQGAAFGGSIKTAAAAFTMPTGSVFRADAPTLGAASAITTQHGFYAGNQGKAGVTNAYGVYIAAQSGAATTNIGMYNAGTSSLIGNIGIGGAGAPNVAYGIRQTTTMATSATQRGYSMEVTSSAAATTALQGMYIYTISAVGTVSQTGLIVDAPSVNAGTTNTYGIQINNQGSANATNSYGIYISAPTGAVTTNIGLYNAGTTQLVGNVGVGSASQASYVLYVASSTATGTTQYGIAWDGSFPSAATTAGNGVFSAVKAAGGAWTMTSGYAYRAYTPSLSNTAVTNIYGLKVDNQGQAKSTNAYGIYIDAQSGAATTNVGLYNAGTTTLVGNTTPTGRLIVPMGEINYFDLTGTVVTISGVSDGTTNYVKAAPTTALSASGYEFDNGGANNGRLRYTGATTKMFHVACSVSFGGGNSDDIYLCFAKGGSIVSTTRLIRKMGAGGDIGSTALHGMIELATNEYVEVFFANGTDTSSITVYALNLFAMGM